MALTAALRRWSDWLFGRWYTGPNAPGRYHDMIRAFTRAHPRATRQQWAHHMSVLTAQAWEDGYHAGYVAVGREPLVRPTPEERADLLIPGWREKSIHEVDVEIPNEPVVEYSPLSDDPRDAARPLEWERTLRRDGLPL